VHSPPYGAPLGSSWAQASDPGTMVSPPSFGAPSLPPPPLPAANTTHATRPKTARGPLVVPGRTVLAASAAALLLLAMAAALFGWLWWTTPRAGREARQDEQQKQVVELVQTGYRSLRAGDPTTAVSVFRRAEEIAPEKQKPPLRNLRVEAERQARMFGQLVEGQKIVVEHLMTAQQAMDNRRFEEALVAADAALLLDPANSKAQQIRTAVQAEQARIQDRAKRQRAQRSAAREEVASNTTAPEPEPLPTAAAEEPVPQTARLHINFQSDMPGIATVMVRVNDTTVLRENVGTKGRFRGGKGGRTGRTVEVAAGNAEIKVWVTPPGEGAKLLTRDGNFPGGSGRSLDIRLSESGQASIGLD
jgi:hypothetical protein